MKLEKKLNNKHLNLITIASIIFGLFSSLSPFGLFAGDLTGLIVFLIALPTFFFLYKWLGKQGLITLIVLLTFYTFIVEIGAQRTGLIYGNFEYSDQLGIKILKSVPWHVPLGYIPIVVGSIIPAYFISQKYKINILIPMAVWILLMDIAIDPAITYSGYWTWEETGRYYGVPLSNFLGWLLTGFVASALFYLFIRNKILDNKPPYNLILSTLINISFWSGYAFANSIFIPSIVGSLIIGALLILRKVY